MQRRGLGQWSLFCKTFVRKRVWILPQLCETARTLDQQLVDLRCLQAGYVMRGAIFLRLAKNPFHDLYETPTAPWRAESEDMFVRISQCLCGQLLDSLKIGLRQLTKIEVSGGVRGDAT